MWSFVVALPADPDGFRRCAREASLPFTLTMVGFGAGGVLMGRLADRFGISLPFIVGALALGARLCPAGVAADLWHSRWRKA